MLNIRNTVLGLLVAGASLGALAQTAAEHAQHHPDGAPLAPATTRIAPSPPGMGQMTGMEQQMKAMQAMHEKMLAAQTPAQRQALMAEHMKLMQDGMAMMGAAGMSGIRGPKPKPGNMNTRQQMMEKRMDMMQSMMQMMMDRMPTPATP